MDDNQVKAPASPGRIQPVDEDVGHQPPKEYPTHPHKHVTSPIHEAARFILWALFWAGISVELIAYFMREPAHVLGGGPQFLLETLNDHLGPRFVHRLTYSM